MTDNPRLRSLYAILNLKMQENAPTKELERIFEKTERLVNRGDPRAWEEPGVLSLAFTQIIDREDVRWFRWKKTPWGGHGTTWYVGMLPPHHALSSASGWTPIYPHGD